MTREKYESLPLSTLKALAKSRNMKGISTLRKEALIERMLEEDQKENQKNMEGILTIVLMYNMRKNKMYCIGIGCAVLTLLSLNEITCFLAMIPVHFYNGKRGLNLKYPFYAFYPVHLLVLFAIAAVLGIAGVAVVSKTDTRKCTCAAWDCALGHSPRRHRRTSGLTLRRAVGRSGFAAQIGVRFYLIYFLTSNGYPKSSSLRITSKFSG